MRFPQEYSRGELSDPEDALSHPPLPADASSPPAGVLSSFLASGVKMLHCSTPNNDQPTCSIIDVASNSCSMTAFAGPPAPVSDVAVPLPQLPAVASNISVLMFCRVCRFLLLLYGWCHSLIRLCALSPRTSPLALLPLAASWKSLLLTWPLQSSLLPSCVLRNASSICLWRCFSPPWACLESSPWLGGDFVLTRGPGPPSDLCWKHSSGLWKHLTTTWDSHVCSGSRVRN